MKLLYATDLHGSEARYRKVLALARSNGVSAIVNGGDMLSMEDDLHVTQRKFIVGFLADYFAECEAHGIHHLALLGNDDLRIHDETFDRICAKSSHTVNLAQSRFELGGFEFIGMNWVVDYPFRLKDRCRKDREVYVFQRQFGTGLLSNEKGFEELEDWPGYAATLPTVEDELKKLPTPADPRKTVYVIHMPPARLGLDVCQSGETVGSEAVYRFIERTQPRLTVHGHIHESPARSGVWRAEVGETVCVQPGQLRGGMLSCALIDLENMEMKRLVESIQQETRP